MGGSRTLSRVISNRGLLTNETRTNWNPTVNTYSYDGMGCRTQKVIGGATTNYTYPCQGAKVKRYFSGVSGVEVVVAQESSPRFWVELSILLSCGRGNYDPPLAARITTLL